MSALHPRALRFAWPRVARAAAFAVLAFAVWVLRVYVPAAPAGADLDSSWQLANTWYVEHGAQAGEDYVLPYGPLGLLVSGSYSPATWGFVVGFGNFVLRLSLALIWVAVAFRLRPRWLILPCALGMAMPPLVIGSWGILSVLFLALFAIDVERPSNWRAAASLALLAVLCATKFTFLMLAFVAVAALVLDAGARQGAGAALWRACGFLGAWVAVWVFSGQNPAYLPTFVRRSMEITSGFSEAMAMPAHPVALRLALVALPLAAATMLSGLLAGWWSARRWISILLQAVAWFLAFKTSFTRHMGEDTFFAFGVVAPWLTFLGDEADERVSPYSDPPSRAFGATRIALAALTTLACWPGYPLLPKVAERGPAALGRSISRFYQRQCQHLLSLGALRRQAEEDTERARAEFRLPRVAAHLGDAEVDVFSNATGVAILNDLNWRPRPVLQGYSAYTPRLARWNADHLASPVSAPFALLTMDAMTDRLPSMEDGLALRLLARDFRPLFEESGYLLLQRHVTPRPLDKSAHEVIVARGIGVGERLDLPPWKEGEAGGRLLMLAIEWNALGRLRSQLYHAPAIELAVMLDQAPSPAPEVPAAIRERVYRIVPGMLEDGVILDPFLETLEDWRGLYSGATGRHVHSIEVRVSGAERKFLQPVIGVRVVRDPGLVGP